MGKTKDSGFDFSLLKQFESITLPELNDTLFKNRYDTKYLFPRQYLEDILYKLRCQYRVLRIGDQRFQHYQSLYFDNEDFKFYLDHQNGKLNRYKVRFRNYPDTRLYFIEVKFKNNKYQTQKWRRQISKKRFIDHSLTGPETAFISRFFKDNPGQLFPRFIVVYSRLAFIHKEKRERVTIDLGLSYFKEGREKKFPRIAIAEVKQAAPSPDSDCSRTMHRIRITPIRFSKYCFGIHLFYPFLKYNRFKLRHLFFDRACGNNTANFQRRESND